MNVILRILFFIYTKSYNPICILHLKHVSTQTSHLSSVQWLIGLVAPILDSTALHNEQR